MSFHVKNILKIQVAPALGCTEPAAIALCCAAAASILPQKNIDSIKVWVDPNIYKNGLAASIPGTSGLSGIDMAAALGAIDGNPSLMLEVLDTITEQSVAKAQSYIKDEKVEINLLSDHIGLHIRTEITSGSDKAVAVISDMHDNIETLTLNDNPVANSALLSKKDLKEKGRLAELETWLKTISLEELLTMIDNLDEEDLDFLEDSIKYNMRLTEHGLKYGPGMGIGKALDRLVKQRFIKKDMVLMARMYTSAAADARMAGVKIPAMSSAGSGNHGLTAVLPIWAIKDFVECDHKTILEAIGLSHMVTAYVKAHTGRLSAVCGCSVAAGAGATAGITYMLGGDVRHVAGAITNLIEDLAGVICDGAKHSCALKLATAAGTAVQAALFSLQGVKVQAMDGIIGSSFEQTAQNIGALSTQGMIEADRTILKIMLDKYFRKIENDVPTSA